MTDLPALREVVADELEAALAIADNCNPPDRTIDEQRDVSVAIHTLAAAVRATTSRISPSPM